MKRKLNRILVGVMLVSILIFVATVGVAVYFFVLNSSSSANPETHDQTNETNAIEVPWVNGGKQPAEYTLEEFEQLSKEQQMAFQYSFESVETFDEWLQRVQTKPIEVPWDNGGKMPENYTWEEYEALTAEQQMAFQNYFESMDDFDRWLLDAQKTESDLPWENGGKQPEDYTWEEYEALTAEQQMAFQNSFESIDAFDAWLQQAQWVEPEVPTAGEGEQTVAVTWEEFENMTPAEQMAFQNSFENIDAFDAWLQNAMKEAGLEP